MSINILPPRLDSTALIISAVLAIFIMNTDYFLLPLMVVINYVAFFSLYWLYRGFSIFSTFKGNAEFESHLAHVLQVDGVAHKHSVHLLVLKADFLKAFRSAGVNAVLVCSFAPLLEHSFIVALGCFVISAISASLIFWVAWLLVPRNAIDSDIISAVEKFYKNATPV